MINQSPPGVSSPWRLLLATAACLLLVSVFAPASVACHKGVPHGNETNCAPSDPLPGESYNIAYFDDSTITVPAQVFRRTDTSTADAGDYVAESPMNVVEIATDDLAKDPGSNKYADLCHAMDMANPSHLEARGPFVGVPSEFSYGWTGNCASDSCVAHISLTFDEGVEELTGGLSDVMTLQMEAQIPGPTGEEDPFVEPQAIAEATCGVLEIKAFFNRIGTSRILFECVLRQQGYGSPVLYTEPVLQ